MIEGTIQTKYTEASEAGVGERSAVRKEATQVKDEKGGLILKIWPYKSDCHINKG